MSITRSMAVAGLFLGLTGLAHADIPPSPRDMAVYTIEVGGDISTLLLVSVPFQTFRQVPIPRACRGTVTEKTFQSNGSTIACREATYCMGHIPAYCTLTFKGLKGQTVNEMITSVKMAQ